MSDPAETTYYIKTEMANDGPYDLDSLRRLLTLGRLTPQDRLLHTGNRTLTTVLAVLPEAQELFRPPVTSDQVVRKTSDRHHHVVQRNRTPLPVRVEVPVEEPVEVPVEEPSAAVEQPVCATTAPLASAPPRTSAQSRRLRIALLVILVLTGINAVVWLLPMGIPDSGPFPPPNIPVLTTAELAELPATRLLSRVEEECMRRMVVSDLDLRVAASVLSPPARHLWNLIEGENSIRAFGLREQLRIERDPTLGVTPLLVLMIESYRALGIDAPARILSEALALPAAQSAALTTLEAAYLASIDSESAPRLVAYATAHRHELFPDLRLQPR